MKKTTKRLLTGFGIVLVLAILALGGYLVKMNAETRKMTPSATGEVTAGVYAVRDSYVNLFLIQGTDGYIAVDAGNSRERVRQEMRALSIDPFKVTAVLLTHTDFDHVAALDLFPRATIYLSKDEEQMIDGTTARFAVIHNRKIPRYTLLNDGQTIEVSGRRVRGMATPGHTPGAMSYLIDGAYLFVGDTMSLKNGKADLFNEFFNMDSAAQEASIRKLAALKNLKFVFTAHYGFTDDPARAFGGR